MHEGRMQAKEYGVSFSHDHLNPPIDDDPPRMRVTLLVEVLAFLSLFTQTKYRLSSSHLLWVVIRSVANEGQQLRRPSARDPSARDTIIYSTLRDNDPPHRNFVIVKSKFVKDVAGLRVFTHAHLLLRHLGENPLQADAVQKVSVRHLRTQPSNTEALLRPTFTCKDAKLSKIWQLI
jgi:hypothetical protein